ncbi:MAG TPA: hypothetical protein VHF00_08080 [Acidimicrobiales bacterium]|nr:hypothetical protein [Acidimicrobiales bacterium]
MDLHAWGRQRAQYSRARRGRNERGAALGECALIQAVTQAMGVRQAARLAALAGPAEPFSVAQAVAAAEPVRAAVRPAAA